MAEIEGKVKAWLQDKGYGFILAEDGKGQSIDVFVHARQLPKGLRQLRPGDRVSFEMRETPRGLQAFGTTLVIDSVSEERFREELGAVDWESGDYDTVVNAIVDVCRGHGWVSA